MRKKTAFIAAIGAPIIFGRQHYRARIAYVDPFGSI